MPSELVLLYKAYFLLAPKVWYFTDLQWFAQRENLMLPGKMSLVRNQFVFHQAFINFNAKILLQNGSSSNCAPFQLHNTATRVQQCTSFLLHREGLFCAA